MRSLRHITPRHWGSRLRGLSVTVDLGFLTLDSRPHMRHKDGWAALLWFLASGFVVCCIANSLAVEIGKVSSDGASLFNKFLLGVGVAGVVSFDLLLWRLFRQSK